MTSEMLVTSPASGKTLEETPWSKAVAAIPSKATVQKEPGPGASKYGLHVKEVEGNCVFIISTNKIKLRTFTRTSQIYSPRRIAITTKLTKDKMIRSTIRSLFYCYVWMEKKQSICLKGHKAQPYESDISAALWIQFNWLESVHFYFNMPHFSYLALKTAPLDLWMCNFDRFSTVVSTLVLSIDIRAFIAGI